jgi:hypothetical protein
MHFRIKHILLFISILGINLILGQGYFSTFFPVNNFSMDARSMAMGGANFGSMQNPAFGIDLASIEKLLTGKNVEKYP